MDFMHAATRSRGGRPIIALPATAASGSVSRIVSSLRPGAGVVTTRGHAQWVVTEFTGTVRQTGAVTKAAEFAAQGCSWDTTDGQPVTQEVTVKADDTEFQARVRIDTPKEVDYFKHGGILPFVLRQLMADAS